jgi:probable addiction module antidote protein
MPKTKTRVWDPAEHLVTGEDMAAYLEAALQEGDSALIAAALGDIARSKGMSCSRVLRPKRCWRTGTAASR